MNKSVFVAAMLAGLLGATGVQAEDNPIAVKMCQETYGVQLTQDYVFRAIVYRTIQSHISEAYVNMYHEPVEGQFVYNVLQNSIEQGLKYEVTFNPEKSKYDAQTFVAEISPAVISSVRWSTKISTDGLKRITSVQCSGKLTFKPDETSGKMVVIDNKNSKENLVTFLLLSEPTFTFGNIDVKVQ